MPITLGWTNEADEGGFKGLVRLDDLRPSASLEDAFLAQSAVSAFLEASHSRRRALSSARARLLLAVECWVVAACAACLWSQGPSVLALAAFLAAGVWIGLCARDVRRKKRSFVEARACLLWLEGRFGEELSAREEAVARARSGGSR